MLKRISASGIISMVALVACDHGERSSVFGPELGPNADVSISSVFVTDASITITDGACPEPSDEEAPVCAVAKFTVGGDFEEFYVSLRWKSPIDGFVLSNLIVVGSGEHTVRRTLSAGADGTWTAHLCETSDEQVAACPEDTERATGTFTRGAPADETPPLVHVTAGSPPDNQDGYFNGSDLAAHGDKIVVTVRAEDGSGVTALICVDIHGGATSSLDIHNQQVTATTRTGEVHLSEDGVYVVRCEAIDDAAVPNRGAALPGSQTTVTVKIDATAPVITRNTEADSCDVPGEAGWCRGTQKAGFKAVDLTSGLRDPAHTAFTKETKMNGAEVEISSGPVADKAGNSAVGIVAGGFMIDTEGPDVVCVAPAPSFLLNDLGAEVTATIQDATSGPVAGIVSARVNTSALGKSTVEIKAEDRAGNSTSAKCAYSVVYGFDGLFAPVHAPETINLSKAGQTIPLKWKLKDAAGNGITSLANVSVKVTPMVCQAGAQQDEIEDYAAGSSGLQNLGGGYYQFNWKTSSALAGSCAVVALDLGEGSARGPLALFQFKN